MDAFLYLGPQELRLGELTPASVAIDTEYVAELQRRDSLLGPPGKRSLQEFQDEIVQDARHPALEAPPAPDLKEVEQHCLALKKGHGPAL